jgi:hypothetical protein
MARGTETTDDDDDIPLSKRVKRTYERKEAVTRATRKVTISEPTLQNSIAQPVLEVEHVRSLQTRTPKQRKDTLQQDEAPRTPMQHDDNQIDVTHTELVAKNSRSGDKCNILQQDEEPKAAAGQMAIGFRAGSGSSPAGEAVHDLCAEVFNVPSTAHQIREYSITVSEKGGDVTPRNMSGAILWLSRYTIAGAISYERGDRKNNLHLQGVCRMRWPSGKPHLIKLRASLRVALGVLPGSKLTVCFKEILTSGNQSFEKTLGYICKDNVQPHFECYLWNIPKEYALRCYKSYVASNLHFEDPRTPLAKKTFYHALNGFYQEHLFPLSGIKTEQLLCWMMMSGEFIPASEWGLPTNGGFLHQGRANSLCDMLCLAPDELKMENIMPLFFGSDFVWVEDDDITLEQFELKKIEATLQREERELPSHKERINAAVDGALVRNIKDLTSNDLYGSADATPGSWLSMSWKQPNYTPPKRSRKTTLQTSQESTSSSYSTTTDYDSEATVDSPRNGKTKKHNHH